MQRLPETILNKSSRYENKSGIKDLICFILQYRLIIFKQATKACMISYNSKLAKLLKVDGITLYPFIFISSLKNDTQIQRDLITHENVHLEQYVQYWIIGFLFLYLYDYGKGRCSGLNHYDAYMNIRFEQDAYLFVRTGRHGDTK